MKEKTVWFGYLEAGAKGSPVVRDTQLDTSNPKTVYLYNLKRNEFVEYSREIVEPKLRELKDKEAGQARELEAAFKKARKTFKGRNTISLAKAPAAAPARPKKEMAEETADIGEGDTDLFSGDDDWSDDD